MDLSIRKFFSNGHERTLKAKKNIFYSILLKGLSIIIGFIVIPITLAYISPAKYGIWLTLSSVIGWLSFFDIGLGNGLKNKLAQANALKDYSKARIYVSTTYAVLSLIASVAILTFFVGNHFINWAVVLNTNMFTSDEIGQLALVVLGLFCIQFVVQTINVVLISTHAPSRVSLINVTGQSISLALIFLLTKFTSGSLLYLVIVLAGIPVLVQLLWSFYYYNTSYSYIAPNFKLIDFKYTRELLSLGGIFFIIQIGALILFQTDNIVITQLFGPEQVTTFNISYKLFSVITMVFSIVITPFWSAFTDAYVKKDFEWIKNVLSKLHKYWLLLCGFTVVLLLLSPLLIKIWLKGSIVVPVSLSIAMALYVIAYTWQTINVYFLNGIGKIKLQLYLVVIGALVNIPIAILFSRYIGVAGVTLANVFVYSLLGIAFSIQRSKILSGTGSKIWYQ